MKSNFTLNLRFLCTHYKSISEVCRRIEINRSQFNKYLSGQACPSPHSLKIICDFFGIEDYEIALPNDQFVKLIGLENGRSIGDKNSFFLDCIAESLGSGNSELKKYLGYYFQYYYSMSMPGYILRTLVKFSKIDSHFVYISHERIGQPSEGGKAPLCRYHGLANFIKDRIFIYEYETLTRNELGETILFPTYKSRVRRLNGLKLGVASSSARNPACARTVWEFLGENIDERKALRLVGLYPSTTSQIDHDIRADIDNTQNIGHVFMAYPK